MNDGKVFDHESYAMIGFDRVSGAGRLFGSPLTNHHGTIRVRIARARREHSLSCDRYFRRGPPVIEVELSAAQFAEMITAMNVGDGVACTLRSFNGQRMADPPDDHTTEVEEIRVGITEKMAALGKRLSTFAREVDTALEAKTLTKDSREKIRHAVGMFVQEVRSNMPFVIDQLQEAAEKTVTAAKAEADAWLTRIVHRAGLKALGAPVQDEGARLDGLELPAHGGDTMKTFFDGLTWLPMTDRDYEEAAGRMKRDKARTVPRPRREPPPIPDANATPERR